MAWFHNHGCIQSVNTRNLGCFEAEAMKLCLENTGEELNREIKHVRRTPHAY